MSSFVRPSSFAALRLSSARSRASESAAPGKGFGAFSMSHCSRNSPARLLTVKPHCWISEHRRESQTCESNLWFLCRALEAVGPFTEHGLAPEFCPAGDVAGG